MQSFERKDPPSENVRKSLSKRRIHEGEPLNSLKYIRTLSICHGPMSLANNAAYDESPRSLHIQLIMAVAVANEKEEAAPGRHSTQHGTSDSQRLVAHDRMIVQRRREPHKSFSQLIKAVAVAHEIVEAPPSCHGTSHGMSDSQVLVAHDQVLVQRRREHRGHADNLNMHRSFERLETNPETSMRGHPLSCQKNTRAMPCPGPPSVESHRVLG